MEKTIKKDCMCVYMCVSHSAVQQKLTQHCKSTILQLKKEKKERVNKNKRLPYYNRELNETGEI